MQQLKSIVKRAMLSIFFGIILPFTLHAQTLPAFPGAEGFGAVATGGRGGQVIYVTSMDKDVHGNTPGTLNWALKQPGPKYILFKVSGVIHARANIVHGNATIAGQTSPGGITVRGMICDGRYERHDCGNIIARHMRIRPAWHLPVPPTTDCADAGETCLSDGLRLDAVKRFIIDHASISNATDETIQISWASDITIQNSIFGELIGGHSLYGGILMNYSHPDYPQNRISIHHNLWYRIEGRLPEINCEASNYGDTAGFLSADCAAHPLSLEVSNNLYFDPGFYMTYARYVNNDLANGRYLVHLNMVNNRFLTRPTFGYGIMMDTMLDNAQNRLYVSGNSISRYASFADYQLFYCCNDFPTIDPTHLGLGLAQRLTARHAFPAITYQSGTALINTLTPHVGALPRDAQDRRYVAATKTNAFSSKPYSEPDANDAFTLDFTSPPSAPIDTDNDGMPDAFEQRYGLNPNAQDHNGSQLSVSFTGVAGYTNLECYLNALADQLANPDSLFSNHFE